MVNSIGGAVEVGVEGEEGYSMAMVETRGVLSAEECEEVSNGRDEEDEVSFYTPGGVPWHGRIPIRGAKSLLPWSILSNGLSTADGSELLCVSRFSLFHSVLRFLGGLGAEMESSSRRRGSHDMVIGEKHGTCRECSRTVGDGVCM